MSEFKVGDRVAVTRSRHGKGISTVKRITARFVELSDGSQWQLDGFGRYPRSKWDTSGIQHLTLELEAQIRRAHLIHILRSADWDNLTDDQLKRLHAILQEPEEEEPTNAPL